MPCNGSVLADEDLVSCVLAILNVVVWLPLGFRKAELRAASTKLTVQIAEQLATEINFLIGLS